MTRKIFTGAATLVALGLLAGGAFGQPKKKERAGDQKKMEGMKLSDEQKAKLQEMHFTFAKEQTMLRAKERVAALELRQMLSEDQPSREALMHKWGEVREYKNQLAQRRFQELLSVRDVLTKDQREAMRHKMGEKFMQRRMHGRPGFMGPGMHRPGQMPQMPMAPPEPPEPE